MKTPRRRNTLVMLLISLSLVFVANCGKSCNGTSRTDGPITISSPGASPEPSMSPVNNDHTEVETEKKDAAEENLTSVSRKIASSIQQLFSDVFLRNSPRPLITNRIYKLKHGDRIRTNQSGEAAVDIGDCMTIYVLGSSGFRLSACSSSRPGLCSGAGTSVFNNRCQSHIRRIETDTAEIRLEGTWFRVAYWPEKKRTIIDVHEGPVLVRPTIVSKSRRLGEAVKIDKGCWCAPAGQCFVPGVPSGEPQPCTKLTAENAAYLERSNNRTADLAIRDNTPIVPEPEINIVPDIPDPNASSSLPNVVDFGEIEAGIELIRTVTITNSSSLPLRIQKISVDDLTETFRTTNETCSGSQVEMGKTCTIRVAFKPGIPGKYENALRILDNAAGSPRSILLRGSATKPWDQTTSALPQALLFGSQSVGVASQSKEVLVFKTKGIATPTVQGPAKEDFKIISNNCTDAASTCELKVVFTPNEIGDRAATLVISGPVARAGVSPATKTVALRGVGALNGKPPTTLVAPLLKVKTDQVCFQSHKVVDPKAVQIRRAETISIENAGTGPLVIKQVVSNTKDFVVKSENCTAGNVSHKCEVSVGFTPTETGTRSGVLTIASNDPNQPAREVRLSGRGKHRNWFIRGVHWLFRINQGDKCKF